MKWKVQTQDIRIKHMRDKDVMTYSYQQKVDLLVCGKVKFAFQNTAKNMRQRRYIMFVFKERENKEKEAGLAIYKVQNSVLRLAFCFSSVYGAK